MVEIRQAFKSFDEWNAWSSKHGDGTVERRQILASIRIQGLVEPITGVRRFPHEIVINPLI